MLAFVFCLHCLHWRKLCLCQSTHQKLHYWSSLFRVNEMDRDFQDKEVGLMENFTISGWWKILTMPQRLWALPLVCSFQMRGCIVIISRVILCYAKQYFLYLKYQHLMDDHNAMCSYWDIIDDYWLSYNGLQISLNDVRGVLLSGM